MLQKLNIIQNSNSKQINASINTRTLYNDFKKLGKQIDRIISPPKDKKDKKKEEEKKKLDDVDLIEIADELKETVGLMRYCIDLLLASFAGAHVSIDPYSRQDAKTTLMQLLSQWTTMLHIVAEDPDFRKRVHD